MHEESQMHLKHEQGERSERNEALYREEPRRMREENKRHRDIQELMLKQQEGMMALVQAATAASQAAAEAVQMMRSTAHNTVVTAEAAASAVARVAAAAAATAVADDIEPTQREPAPTMDVDDGNMKELKEIPKGAMSGLTKVSLTFEREARRLAKKQ